MRSSLPKKIFFLLLIEFLLFSKISFTEEGFPFQGNVNSDNINLRSDSTVNSKIICTVDKGERLDVILEWHDWYKVRLPKKAPLYIKKNMLECMTSTEKNRPCLGAKVIKDRVNVRLGPTESSPVLGQLKNGEVVNILGDPGDWFKVEPVKDSFGWIHKKFVDKVSDIKTDNTNLVQPLAVTEEIKKGTPSAQEEVFLEGIINPYGRVFKRTATHKLITKEGNIFLLRGKKNSLDTLNYQKVRVTGKKINSPKEKYPIIEIGNVEVMD
jgi:uncharacterized protein YgiM (DUF1202 family)